MGASMRDSYVMDQLLAQDPGIASDIAKWAREQAITRADSSSQNHSHLSETLPTVQEDGRT